MKYLFNKIEYTLFYFRFFIRVKILGCLIYSKKGYSRAAFFYALEVDYVFNLTLCLRLKTNELSDI